MSRILISFVAAIWVANIHDITLKIYNGKVQQYHVIFLTYECHNSH